MPNHCASSISSGAGRDLAAGVVGDEGDHQRMRKRPGLAGEIARIGDAHARFLQHLAREALLQRFARFDETGERAVHAGRKTRRAREQDFVSAPDQAHHRRRDARIDDQGAGGAFARALAAAMHSRRAAAAAELMGAVPVDVLQRASGEGEQAVVQPAVQRAQSLPQHALRCLRVGAVLEGETGTLAQGAQIQAAQRGLTEPGKFPVRRAVARRPGRPQPAAKSAGTRSTDCRHRARPRRARRRHRTRAP